MKALYWLGAIPFAGLLGGGWIAEHVGPLVWGMPFLMVWNTAWLFLSSAIMATIYRLDVENRRAPDAWGDAE